MRSDAQVEEVNALLQRVNGIVWRAREKGIVGDQQARVLLHPEMALSVFTDFGRLVTALGNTTSVVEICPMCGSAS